MTATDGNGGIRGEFRKSVNGAVKRQRKAARPFSIRLSEDERAFLIREAGKLSVAAHVRRKLFGDAMDTNPRRKATRQVRVTSADRVLFGRVLAALGQSELSVSLADIARAAAMGALPVTPELVQELSQACVDIKAMRNDLIAALGLKPDGET